MSCCDPDDDEEAEENIANGGVAHVLEAFCELYIVRARTGHSENTYRKNQVYSIHHAENQVCYFGLMVAITGENQASGDNVMREHLPMIFPPLLNVDDHDLLEPKGVLSENVPFLQPAHLSIGPIGPEILEVKQVVRVNQNILLLLETLQVQKINQLTRPSVQKTE